MSKREYVSPFVESFRIETPGCIMASGEGSLGNLEENPIISDTMDLFPIGMEGLTF